ncbi:MAG: type I-F CRISPR-associated endoribonuclease Cas6/Csy4 [Rhodoferax sp.]
MDHHVDIDVQPDPEFPAHQLMEALYAKLHRALVAQNSTRIGVSFPGFGLKGPHLGTRLRLHGNLAALSALLASDWLAAIRDHVTLTQPTRVPETAKHCAVRRVQVKSSPERLRRRLMRRHNLDAQEALQRIPDEAACLVDLPFVQLRSTSTGQSFRLFIEHGPALVNPIPGDFNAYGLSQLATIPWF